MKGGEATLLHPYHLMTDEERGQLSYLHGLWAALQPSHQQNQHYGVVQASCSICFLSVAACEVMAWLTSSHGLGASSTTFQTL